MDLHANPDSGPLTSSPQAQTTSPGHQAGPDPNPPDMLPAPNPRRWWILGVVGVAQLMIVLDSTITNIALPSAQRDLGFATSDSQWIVTAYALTFGSFLLLGGRIGDIFGRKWTFIGGLIGFAIASVIGGAAPDFAVLAAARSLQGLFGALLAPSALSLLATTFSDPKERGKAFAVFGAVAGGGGAIGLLLGGVLTSYLSWRWCLYVNLVFAIGAAIGGFVLLSNPPRTQRSRIDIPGVILASAGMFGVVFGLSRATSDSWSSAVTLVPLGVGLVLLAAFVQVQREVTNPLLPLRVVLDRNRAGAYLAVGLTFVAGFGLFLFLTYFLQNVRGMSPVRTGVAFLPLPVDIVFASTIANVKLLPRFGPRRLIIAGFTFSALGFALLTQLDPGSTYFAHVFPSLVLIGLGIGFSFPPATNIATRGVAFRDAGVASAMVNTMQQIGGSVGVALLSAFAAQSTSRYFHNHNGNPADLTRLAAAYGYTVAFAISTAVLVGAGILCGALIPKHPAQQSSAAPAPSIGAVK